MYLKKCPASSATALVSLPCCFRGGRRCHCLVIVLVVEADRHKCLKRKQKSEKFLYIKIIDHIPLKSRSSTAWLRLFKIRSRAKPPRSHQHGQVFFLSWPIWAGLGPAFGSCLKTIKINQIGFFSIKEPELTT
jgi:hypothetical protein